VVRARYLTLAVAGAALLALAALDVVQYQDFVRMLFFR
jgi:hypothetical protein